MVTSADASDFSITSAASFHSAVEAGDVSTYYVWETDLNHWQQQTILVDNTDTIVSFDPPIGFKYTHSTANDRNSDSSKDGAVFMLEYRGNGNLSGIPGEVYSNNNWRPAITLADGVLVGDNSEYVVKAMDIQQSMTTAEDSACEKLSLDAPSQPIPTAISQDMFGLGTLPNVMDQSPSVISGEVQ